ncbi:MAG: histidine ammonia-lyase [Methanomassiliicoccales archaeon]|nr:histidine ammonia-lyase [Methanomassiliicoccales archaeon]
MKVQVDGRSLSLADVEAVAKHGTKAALSRDAAKNIRDGRKALEAIIDEGKVAYGVNTGVGELRTVCIPPSDLRELQTNLIRSTACGVGEPLPTDVVRAMMLLRANALSSGLSGVREELVRLLIDMLNAGVVPIVPSRGSVGSSGDLVPLAHMSLPLIGEGEAYLKGKRMEGGAALRAARLAPLVLEAKEGLALINGTQMMTAIGCLGLQEADRLVDASIASVAMAVDALKGTPHVFDERLFRARPHPGAVEVAKRMRRMLSGSEIAASHADCHEVQDAYTLRCAPQVIGACIDSLAFAREVIAREVNSVTDNPLVFDGEVVSGGNFHGQPVAMALDQACLALHVLAAFSERRTARLLDGKLSHLPDFLVESEGLESGMMILQYTAAGLVSENKLLSSPASADSLPTSANQEDYNSMGSVSALKLMQVVHNAKSIVAIELICAAQALDFQELRPGEGADAARRAVRAVVDRLKTDRQMSGDIKAVEDMIGEDAFSPGRLLQKRART